MRRTKHIITITIAVLAPLALLAQAGQTSGSVTITTSATLEVEQAEKIPVAPQPENIQKPAPQVELKREVRPMAQTPEKTKLSAPSIVGDRLPLLYHNYVNVSGGNYQDINAEFRYNTLRNKTSLLAIEAKHHRGKGPVQFSNFGENRIALYGKHILKPVTFTGQTSFDHNTYHKYGSVLGINEGLRAKDLAVNYTRFNMGGQFSSNTISPTSLRYGGNANYTFFGTRSVQENNLGFGLNLAEPFQGNLIRANASLNLQPTKVLDTNFTRSVFAAGASYKFLTNDIDVVAGFGVASVKDTAAGSFHVFPDITASYAIGGGGHSIFAALRGGVRQNTFESLAMENPFLNDTLRLRHTVNSIGFNGGMHGALSSAVYYRAEVGYNKYINLPFFISSADGRDFHLVYERAAKVFHTSTELGIQVRNNFILNGSLGYFHYDLNNMEHAWHRPGLETRLTARYAVAEKITFLAELYGWNRRHATRIGTSEVQVLNGFADANLSVMYRFSNESRQLSKLSAYIAANNIANTNYQLWNYYPVRGFQLRGGIVYSFMPPPR